MAPESTPLELHNLGPEPADEMHRMVQFVGLSGRDKGAMAKTVEVLFKRGHEMIVGTYDYLRTVPETAAILGWEKAVDETHLEERRRFFTVWLTRTLGLDTSDEFAYYLFRAGKFHAGRGPRKIHTPPAYVTGSMGMVLAGFSQYMLEANLPAEITAPAMAGWSKYLMVQLNQMSLGYQTAFALNDGDVKVKITSYGRVRPLMGSKEIDAWVGEGEQVEDVLDKFFNYFPQIRPEALERCWKSEELANSLWMEVKPFYRPKPGWRVLHNGRDVMYSGGFSRQVYSGDEIAIFPPGR